MSASGFPRSCSELLNRRVFQHCCNAGVRRRDLPVYTSMREAGSDCGAGGVGWAGTSTQK